MDVEETPLVESLRVGEENVGRVAVHGDRSASNQDNLSSSPAESDQKTKQEEDGKHNLSGRVALGKLPEGEDADLRETDEADAEEDTLKDGLPAIAELSKLVIVHPSLLGSQIKNALEDENTENSDDGEDAEKDEHSQKDVGGHNIGLDTNTLDTKNDVSTVNLNISTLRDVDSHIDDMLRHHSPSLLRQTHAMLGCKLNTSLLDSNKTGGNGVKN